MLFIISIVVAGLISWGMVETALSFTRDNCWTSLIVWGFAIATGLIVPWVIVDGIVSMTRSDI